MTQEIKFYQNNPCTIIKVVNDQFSEICLSHRFAADMEITGQCEGCCIGDSDNKISCTCDDHSWIIEQIQDEENAIICMVETRLLLDKPIEGKAIKKLQVQIAKQQEEFSATKELHEEWQESLRSLQTRAKSLQVEINALELSREANDNLRKTTKAGINKLCIRFNKILVDIGKYERGSKQVTMGAYNALEIRSCTLAALEKGGVDNWEWYEESLKNAGLKD
tara:strand:- start:71 stop:736 length:666 start_codon:yes stop_codon:yes gene_type:complete